MSKPSDVLEGLTTSSWGGVADFHGVNVANGHLQLPTGYKLALKIPETFIVGSGEPTQASFGTALGKTHRLVSGLNVRGQKGRAKRTLRFG